MMAASGIFKTKKNAEERAMEMRKKGFKSTVYPTKKGWKVSTTR